MPKKGLDYGLKTRIDSELVTILVKEDAVSGDVLMDYRRDPKKYDWYHLELFGCNYSDLSDREKSVALNMFFVFVNHI